ncbi:MAG: bifunctional 5,10-methylenetetrahydrofolate dehydrogenase/5,10-methenyltetrahydrofolate cyclohydrolase [Patescibacteria group bacterium]
MSATILDGRATRATLIPGLLEKIAALTQTPTLVIIQLGDRPDSRAFIKAKKSFAKEIGVKEKHIKMPEATSEEEVLQVVQAYNTDPTVQGIIVQLPLPTHVDADKVIEAIDPKKDVDGLTSFNMKALADGQGTVMLATARGIRELLDHHSISLAGKVVTIIGRSKLVGQPIAAMCRAAKAEVIVCDRTTADLVKETQKADIVIVAAGHPGLVTVEHVKPGQVIVDVGITRSADSGLVGDVDFDAVKDVVGAITPVPGGVGPMTVFALFENLVDLSV